MNKRIYIAAPWIDRALVPEIAHKLESHGYSITHKWWQFEGEEEDTSKTFRQMCAKQDIRGVRTADLVLLLNSSKSEGKAVEQGIALAYGIPIVCIGDGTHYNIFQYLHNFYWVSSVEKAIQVIQELLYE